MSNTYSLIIKNVNIEYYVLKIHNVQNHIQQNKVEANI